nr:putative deoxyribonuclease RhsC [Chlamydiota bacterium]
SKRHDAETGLIYFGRRYYDPELGRFITADPEGYVDSANLYAFVLNNPLIQHDLYGLIMAYYNPKWIDPSRYSDFTHPYQNLAGMGWNDLYQSFAGTVHGSFQNVINRALGFSRYASGMEAFGVGSQANQQWQTSSEKWFQDVLRADPSHPGYRGMFQASYVGTDIATAFVPFGMVTKIDKARKAVPVALKTGRTVKRLFQTTRTPVNSISWRNSVNPFKGKTFQEIDQLLRSKGFITKGPDPLKGKGSYFHPITNRKYYLDNAGKTYKRNITELPHVDVHYNGSVKGMEKQKFPIGEYLYEFK